MTRDEFRAWLKSHDLTIARFAFMTGTDRVTVSMWGGERNGVAQRFPAWVILLMDAWEAAGGPPRSLLTAPQQLPEEPAHG